MKANLLKDISTLAADRTIAVKPRNAPASERFNIMLKRPKIKTTTPAVVRLKPSTTIKPFLKSDLPRTASFRTWDKMTEPELAEFKAFCTSRPDNVNKRRKRRDIKKWFGKSVKELTLAEFKDYQKPNFHASDYLKELWPQLTAAEQDLVKQLNQWAFVFPASFDTGEQYLRACAARLERFFGRKFRVKRVLFKGVQDRRHVRPSAQQRQSRGHERVSGQDDSRTG